MHVHVSCTQAYGCTYRREIPLHDKQVAEPEPCGGRQVAVLKEKWSHSNEEWDHTVLCKGYRKSLGREQQ